MIICEFENGGKGKLRHVVVDTIVTKGNKILLVKRAKKLLEGGKWGLVGGFVDRDETIKQAVEREVLEETGYEIKNIIFLRVKDRPNRPNEDRQNIAFVFVCETTKKIGNTDWEVDEVRWFDFDSLPNSEQIAFDHLEDLGLYQKFLKQKLSFPILNNL